jgi:long-chain acyl-CoA synthetase
VRDRYQLALTVGTEPAYYGAMPGSRDRVAVVCGDDQLTWSELAARVHTLARAWENLGLERGAKVATLLRNRIEVPELVYSLARVGITNVTINAKYTAREVAETIAFSDAGTVVVDASLLGVLDQALEDLSGISADDVYVVGARGPHPYRGYDDLLATGDGGPIVRDPDEDDIVWMAFTGGTTGKSKACLAPQRGWVRLWTAMCMELGLGRRDVVLVCGSMNHALGLLYGLAILYAGGKLVVLPEFDPAAALRAIEEHRVTFLPLVPSLFKMIVDSPDRPDRDTSSIRRVLSTGAPLTSTTREQILSAFAGAEFISAYGATESGFTTLLHPEDQHRKAGSVGLPLRGMEVGVFDDQGKACGAGEIGTIYKRGWNVAVEYYKDPEATEAAFMGDWHTVGDMGYLDDEGYLFITDRRKNMIISGGINVYPAEVEDVIGMHPAVAESAVIGVPDEVWGEAVHAVVVLCPGSHETAESLSAFCREHLAGFKQPRRFEFRDALPKTYAGKVSHRELREPFWAGHDNRI